MEATIPKATLEEMARQLGIVEDDITKYPFFRVLEGIIPVYFMNLSRMLAPYGGAIEDNYGSKTLENNTSASQIITVPAGKRWYLFGGHLMNGDDVVRACYVQLRNASNQVIAYLAQAQNVGANARLHWPNTEAVVTKLGGGGYPIPMLAGYNLYISWAAGGASAGGASPYSAFVVEMDE